VEFTESLPTDFKLRRGKRKIVERAAMSDLLPHAIFTRKERGFNTPIDRWLREDLHAEARERLLAPDGVTGSLMDRDNVAAILDAHRDGRADHTRQIFILFSLELWAERFLRAPVAVA
jgi:asparagine synthase (glutamine-hydrolysing)